MRTTSPLVIATLMAWGSPLWGQGRELTVEASVLRGAVGYAWQTAPRLLWGIEAGFGFPQIDQTLTPVDPDDGDPDFEEYLHAALFTRLRPSPRFEIDAGVRGSLGDLWSCTASDCWPAPFGGAYIQPMVGGTRFKVGVRLTAGWIGETEGSSDSSTFLVALAPLIVRLTMPL
jgi:hypothetical protein